LTVPQLVSPRTRGDRQSPFANNSAIQTRSNIRQLVEQNSVVQVVLYVTQFTRGAVEMG
jgi:hypothetical protein